MILPLELIQSAKLIDVTLAHFRNLKTMQSQNHSDKIIKERKKERIDLLISVVDLSLLLIYINTKVDYYIYYVLCLFFYSFNLM